MDRPPTIEELVGCAPPVIGLDERYVVEHFQGKSQAEAIQEYRKQGSYLTEDFAYMAADGRRYYLRPAIDYLREGKSDGDCDFCHGLMCSLYVQARHRKSLPADVVDMMKEIARYCDAHRDWFGLAPEEELFDEYVKTILST